MHSQAAAIGALVCVAAVGIAACVGLACVPVPTAPPGGMLPPPQLEVLGHATRQALRNQPQVPLGASAPDAAAAVAGGSPKVLWSCTVVLNSKGPKAAKNWPRLQKALDSIVAVHGGQAALCQLVHTFLVVNEYSSKPGPDWTSIIGARYPWVTLVNKTSPADAGQAKSLNVILDTLRRGGFTHWIQWEESWFADRPFIQQSLLAMALLPLDQLDLSAADEHDWWSQRPPYTGQLVHHTIAKVSPAALLCRLQVLATEGNLDDAAAVCGDGVHSSGGGIGIGTHSSGATLPVSGAVAAKALAATTGDLLLLGMDPGRVSRKPAVAQTVVTLWNPWPLWSLRPSMIRVATVGNLGDFDTRKSMWPIRFEWEFGRRFVQAGLHKAVWGFASAHRQPGHVSSYFGAHLARLMVPARESDP